MLSAAQLGAVRNALAQGGAFAPGPPVLFLRSDRFYWTAALCSGGRFTFRAFKAPPQELVRLPFAVIILRLDETGAPYNRPRPTEIDRLTNFGRISEPRSQNSFMTFELQAGSGGLK